MVSLEEKACYQNRIRASPKLTAFNNLLLGKSFSHDFKTSLNESDEIFYGILRAIQTNDKKLFETYYFKKSKSIPSKESPSPFVNDDFLIFGFIEGIMKFGIDKSWIKYIISLRAGNPFTITLENIVNENFFSKSNLPEIVLMFFKQYDHNLITNDFLTISFKSISDNTVLFGSKSDFHIICALRAYDLIVELKEAVEGSEVYLLREFNLKFISRVKGFTWLIQTILLVTLFYGLIEIISIRPAIKIYIDKLGSILKFLGLIGISQLGNAFPFIKKKLFELMLGLFGYPNKLIKKINNEN